MCGGGGCCVCVWGVAVCVGGGGGCCVGGWENTTANHGVSSLSMSCTCNKRGVGLVMLDTLLWFQCVDPCGSHSSIPVALSSA